MNPKTTYQLLVDNTVFNSGASAFLQSIAGHVPDNDATRLIKNLQHIQKEAQEGIDALQKCIDEGATTLGQEDTKKVRDAYADVRVLLDGASQMAAFPFASDYRAVLSSLITRFDATHGHAVLTQEKYAKLGVLTRIHADEETGMFVNIVSNNDNAEDPSEYPVGKWLKSYQFEEPVFEDGALVINLKATTK